MSEFREAFLRARQRLEAGEDPEQVVPEVIAAAEAPEEIELAEQLWEQSDSEVEEEGV
ncbi:MAG TPA: hypothetical protein VHL51_06455 [Gaiellales bacterium]|jgi:hypothetical protein|nr:hypothetical protein [Gaiellales bacterium]